MSDLIVAGTAQPKAHPQMGLRLGCQIDVLCGSDRVFCPTLSKLDLATWTAGCRDFPRFVQDVQVVQVVFEEVVRREMKKQKRGMLAFSARRTFFTEKAWTLGQPGQTQQPRGFEAVQGQRNGRHTWTIIRLRQSSGISATESWPLDDQVPPRHLAAVPRYSALFACQSIQ